VLMEGKIRVNTPVGNLILLPNEKVMYDRSKKRVRQSKVSNAGEFKSWINNKLRFENESLPEIANTLQRIYNVKIVFANSKLKEHYFTGTVSNVSIERVLNFIALTAPIDYDIEGETVVIRERIKQ
jgi:transmembrane sensor